VAGPCNLPEIRMTSEKGDIRVDRWSSHIGFILAAIGAAVGLGNIWRFSAVLGQNGGGAYLIPYFIAVFLFALPLMVLEITMGRVFRGTVVSAFGAVRPQFRLIGWFICALSFLITSYYLVVTGWTIAYLTFSATGKPVAFGSFTASFLPLPFVLLAVLITGLIVSYGVRRGIERMAVVLIPICITLLGVMALFGATLPGFAAGMTYLLTPDFSILSNPRIWLAAFGQALFSLSVGEGILLTYGAYMAEEQDIRKAALVITITDTSVALLAGAIIFPVVFTYGISPIVGAELAFSTLPIAFAAMPFGRLVATAFFALLVFAAITTSVACLEVCVAAVSGAMTWSRRKTTTILTVLLLGTSLLPALSYSILNLSIAGVPVLDFMDETIGTLGLHIAAILLAVTFTWFVSPDTFSAGLGGSPGLNRIAFLLCKYLIPGVLILTVGADMTTGLHNPALSFISGAQFTGPVLQGAGIILFVLVLLVISMIAGSFRK
jgi:NSS family neurotransmitter:Na+ symporter